MGIKKHVDLLRRPVENWLISNRKYLRFLPLEKELRMPEDSLSKFVRGKRQLSDDEIEKGHQFIKEFFLSYDQDYDIDEKD